MILHPRFYDPPVEDRSAERVRIGLRPDLPTALVLFGGHGSESHAGYRRSPGPVKSRSSINLDLRTGTTSFRDALQAKKSRLPRFVEGFTSKVNHYMQLADFFIGKPGPGSVSEALAMKLPVIVECNAWTLPQERYNAVWIVEKEVGLVLKNFRKIDEAVARLIEPATLARYRANAAALHNRRGFRNPQKFCREFSTNREEFHADPAVSCCGNAAISRLAQSF